MVMEVFFMNSKTIDRNVDLYTDFYVNRNFKNRELNILSAGRHINIPPYVSHQENYNSYSMHYILKGQGTLRYEGKSVTLKEGDIFLLFPDCDYYYETSITDPWDYIWVEFLGQSADYIIKGTEFSKEEPFLYGKHNLKQHFKNIIAHKGTNDSDRYAMLGHLYILLSKLMVTPADNKDRETLSIVLDYIKNHYSEDISVDKLAFATKISRDYLCKVFMNELNTIPSSYIVRYRVYESLYLLSNTDYTIAKISNMVGFYDQFHFSKSFKKVLGMTPSQYRKNLGDVRAIKKDKNNNKKEL